MNDAILLSALRADVPVVLWGPPGSGKTAMIKQMARDNGAHLETVIGSTLLPEDMSGYLYTSKDSVSVKPPDWAVRMKKALDANKPAWLFLDELSCTGADVQAAMLRVIHERQVAGVDLSGCRVIAAANRADYAARGGDLPAPTANRFVHVDWKAIEASTWAQGLMSGNWGAPERLEPVTTAARVRAKANVASFIQKNPQRLMVLPDPGSEAASGAWPSPRSWEMAAALLGEVGGASSKHAFSVVAAAVGRAAASEWQTWSDALDLPDPEDLLTGKAKMPDRADRQAAALSALVSAALLKDNPDRTARVKMAWKLIGKCRPDAALLPAKVLMNGAPELEESAEAMSLGKRLIKVK